MNKSSPELPLSSEKKTVELCADKLNEGIYCLLTQGHDGDHEFHSPYVTGAITWKPRSS